MNRLNLPHNVIRGIVLIHAIVLGPAYALQAQFVKLEPSYDNKVQDSSFEEGSWTLTHGAEYRLAAHTGKQSVRIQRDNTEQNPTCTGKAIGISPGRHLLSGWFRSNATEGADRNFAAEVNVTWRSQNGKELGKSRGLDMSGVTPAWTYKDFSVIAPPGVGTAEIMFSFTGPIVGMCDLDDVVLSPVESGADIEVKEVPTIHVRPERPIFPPGEKPVINITLWGPRKHALPVTCQVVLYDSLGHEWAEGRAEGEVPTKWRKITSVELTNVQSGPLPIGEWLQARITVRHEAKEAEGNIVAVGECGVLVLPRPEDYSLDTESRFGLLVGHTYTKRWLGARFERPSLCNERRLERASRYGVNCMPLYASIPFDKVDEPGGADELSKEITEYVTENAKYLNYLQYYNEPHLWQPGVTEKYVKALRIAYGAAKKAKPGIKIAAAGITALNVDEDMVARMLDAGAAEVCDLIDIHTYLSIHEMDRLTGKVRRQMEERGVDKPLIITEVTYNHWSSITPLREQSSRVYQRHAIAFSHGVAQMYWFVMHGITDRPGHFRNCGLIDVANMAPRPAAAAYAKLAHLLNGLPYRTREKKDGCWSFTFSDDTRSMFIAWSDTDEGGLALADVKGEVRVYDVNGREYTLKTEDEAYFGLTREPLLISCSSAQATLITQDHPSKLNVARASIARGNTTRIVIEDVSGPERGVTQRDAIEAIHPRHIVSKQTDQNDIELTISPKSPLGHTEVFIKSQKKGRCLSLLRLPVLVTDPLEISIRPFARLTEHSSVIVNVSNLSSGELSGKANVLSHVTEDLRPANYALTFSGIPPQQSRRFELNLAGNVDPLSAYRFEAEAVTDEGAVSALTRNLIFAPAPRAMDPIVIDGSLEDWNTEFPIRIDSQTGETHIPEGSSNDSNDISARAAIAWTEEFLLLAIKVRDDKHYNGQDGARLWDGDSMQIGITDSPCNNGAESIEFSVGSGLQGEQAWIHRNFIGKPTGQGVFPISVKRSDPFTIYEIAVPWKLLSDSIQPKKGTWLGVGMTVNEDDGQGRGYIGWHAGIAIKKDSALYGQVTLLE